MPDFSSVDPLQALLDRAGGRAELLVHFANPRGYEVIYWNRAASELFSLENASSEHPALRWEELPAFLAQYLSQALQTVSGAPEDAMPDLTHPTRPDQHYFAKVFYQSAPAEAGTGKEEEHWYLFCFQDSVNWLEHSQGAVNRKKLETIGELASGVAHDFNNLIMGIQSNAEAMLAHPNMSPRRGKASSISSVAAPPARLSRAACSVTPSGNRSP